MNEIQRWGIDFILALQSHQSPLLDTFFYVASQLGGFAYVLIIPILVWCIEPRLGLRTLLAMIIAQYIVMLIKDIVQEPRPFMADSRIASDGEHGFSFPSGHAMGSMVFYGLLLLWTEKIWLRWVLGAVIFSIGLSRNYLGVHYPHDVLTGWILGIMYLYGWLLLQKSAADNLYAMARYKQLALAVTLPTIVAVVHLAVFDYFGAIPIAGAVTAALLCLAAEQKKPTFNVQGSIGQLILRYLVGLPLTMGVFIILTQLSPEGQGSLKNIILWVQGFATVGMIGYVVPQIFVRIKLAPAYKA